MELTASAVQTVAANQDVLFTDTAVRGNCSMLHREGSGLVTVRGLGNQCRAQYKFEYSGNIAVPADGTAGPISVALAVEGEPLASSVATVTPTVAGAFFNVALHATVEAPRGCCVPVSVRNTNGQAIEVANSNLIVTRTA